jgi:hypothetical protein
LVYASQQDHIQLHYPSFATCNALMTTSMLQRSLLRLTPSFFDKYGVCLFCRASKLQPRLTRGLKKRAGYWEKAPSTIDQEFKSRSPTEHVNPDEAVARQLGKPYVSREAKQRAKSEARIPAAVMTAAYKAGRVKVLPSRAQQLLMDFEKLGTKPKPEDLKRICSSKMSTSQSDLRLTCVPRSPNQYRRPHRCRYPLAHVPQRI